MHLERTQHHNMGTEAPRWYRQLLDQLQEASLAAAESSTAVHSWQPANMQDICDTVTCLDELPAKLPKAVWKKVMGLQASVVGIDSSGLVFCSVELFNSSHAHGYWQFVA